MDKASAKPKLLLSIPSSQSVNRRAVFEKSSTPKFDVDDVRFLKKFGTLSFKI
jgi:hypothetical protein